MFEVHIYFNDQHASPSDIVIYDVTIIQPAYGDIFLRFVTSDIDYLYRIDNIASMEIRIKEDSNDTRSDT